MAAIRWSDNDKYFGIFTISQNNKHHNPLAFVLSSGGGDYGTSLCNLRVSVFGWTAITPLPRLVKPWRRWIDTSHYEWSKSPDSGYWDIHAKEYGFSYNEGFLRVFLGAQTMDSSTTKRWSKFLPWTQWRHVRHSFYDTEGVHFCDVPQKWNWEEMEKQRKLCPSTTFEFKDYDGEELTAKTRIEEREWHFGTGWFKWLSFFRKPRISRYLEIQFSDETGKRKGSWKGGTVGHSIEMQANETPWQAFKRYCEKHDMTFLGIQAKTKCGRG